MGFIAHTVIAVTGCPREQVALAKAYAEGLGLICTGIYESQANGYHSFMTVPDGSKAGWEIHTEASASREAFIKWLKDGGWEFGETTYGSDLG